MVIADTSPLNYLILIGAEGTLRDLYGEIAVPEAVLEEMLHPATPPAVIQWISKPPEWIRIVRVGETADPTLNELGAGERQAIALAQNQTAAVLLMDEIQGRSEAARRGIPTIGTLGVLDEAAQAGLLDLPATVGRLRHTTFYATPSLFKRLLDRDAARRRISDPRT